MNSSEKRPLARAERTGQVCTVIMVVMAGVGGVLNLAQFTFPLAQELGLPWFIGIVLGVAKVLGVLTFFTRSFPMLREWAYAGLTFELLGAAGCHILAGISVLHAVPALFDLSFVLASYFLWHRAPGGVGHSIAIHSGWLQPAPDNVRSRSRRSGSWTTGR
jgi:DoxX-like family